MDSSSEIYNKLDPASDLQVLYAGRQDCPPGHTWKGRRHHALLHHVLGGRGKVRFGRKEWSLGSGDSFLFYPYTDIWYEADSDEPWRYAWVGIGGARLVHYLELCRFRSDEPVLFAKEGRSPGPAFLELLDTLDDPSLAQGRRMILVQARLLALLDALASYDDDSSPAGSAARPREETPYVQEILDFLDQAYSRDLSAETIARFAGLERSYCSALFSSTTGTSLMRYLGDLRMEKALELLRGTNLSVRAIAESVGYADPAVFAKRFKRTKGLSPTQARRPGPD